MPIGGIVISVQPEDSDTVLKFLEPFTEVEIHGADDKGNIVAVLDCVTSDAMEQLMKKIEADERVLHIGLTYLNSEDEAAMIASGEYTPKIFGTRKHEKDQG